MCPQQALYGFRGLLKSEANFGSKTPWLPCQVPTTAAVPPARSFPPAGWTPTSLTWQYSPGEVFSWPSSLLPGVSVYVLDGFNTTQTVVANLNANGTYPVCMIRWAPQLLCSGVQLLCTCAPSKRHIPENALAVQADATPGDELCSIATGQHILQLQSTDSTSLHAAGLAPLRPGLRIKQTLRPVATPLWVSLGASG